MSDSPAPASNSTDVAANCQLVANATLPATWQDPVTGKKLYNEAYMLGMPMKTVMVQTPLGADSLQTDTVGYLKITLAELPKYAGMRWIPYYFDGDIIKRLDHEALDKVVAAALLAAQKHRWAEELKAKLPRKSTGITDDMARLPYDQGVYDGIPIGRDQMLDEVIAALDSVIGEPE